MQANLKKRLFQCLGYTSIMLGVIGIFVPLMPTTCFLIAAVWCFFWSDMKSVEKIFHHKQLGPIIGKVHPRFLPKI